MRFEINCELENKEIGTDYARKILSFIKGSLENYNEEIYREFYEKGVREKDYSFACYFPINKIENDKIYLNGNRFKITMSFLNMLEAIHFYNAFVKSRNKKFKFGNENNFKVVSIRQVREKEIESETVIFRTMSPVLIREKAEGNKSWYYLINEEKGMEILKQNLIHTLSERFSKEKVEELQIIPVDVKKTVVHFYSLKFQASRGIFVVKGDKKILEYFYKAGFGSRKSIGFGLLEIIK